MQRSDNPSQQDAVSGSVHPTEALAAPAQPSSKGAVVSVVATTPETVIEDYQRAMELAGVTQYLSTTAETLLKINISWQHWYPGCSTAPWQLEGVIKGLRNLGYANLTGAHNGTVVVDSFEGEESSSSSTKASSVPSSGSSPLTTPRTCKSSLKRERSW